jgi:ribosomal protein S18 acetylase RimI-like enzyme
VRGCATPLQPGSGRVGYGPALDGATETSIRWRRAAWKSGRWASGDLGAVQEVARITWAETYRGIIPEDELTSFVERAYSEKSLEHRMETGVFLVAVVGGEVVGFADFDPEPGKSGEVELAAIYVLPEMQGRGVGTRLLEAGIGRFGSAGSLTLRVARDNLGGRRFYEARGFRSVGEHVWRTATGEVYELEMVLEIGRNWG